MQFHENKKLIYLISRDFCLDFFKFSSPLWILGFSLSFVCAKTEKYIECFCLQFHSRYTKNDAFYYTRPILHGLIHVARSGSVYVTMAVTIERYFAIVHPLKDFKIKKALLPIAVIFAIVYNIPKVISNYTIQYLKC